MFEQYDLIKCADFNDGWIKCYFDPNVVYTVERS